MPPPLGTQPGQPVPPGAPGQPAEARTPPPPTNPNTTQNTLLFSELRDNMVVMNDGSFRAVIACKSINFDLMSSKEREGIEYSYQNFLNSLYFPVQILIRSQRVDIGPYIERLTNIRRDQENMLLNVLTDDYIDFIDTLSQEANIMDKTFYVIIPYWPHGDLNTIKRGSKSLFSTIFGGAPKQRSIVVDHAQYEKAKDEIKNHVDSVMSGLFQMGIKCVQLNTKELGELYYNFYNPDTAVREPLGNFESITAMYVRKGVGEAPRPHLIREEDRDAAKETQAAQAGGPK
jgi:type IV secretory pathway VirB4 component